MNIEKQKERLKEQMENLNINSLMENIICDGCSKRINIDDTETMTGYASTPRGRKSPWHLLKVYCEECNNREINTPTSIIGEAMIEFNPDITISKNIATEVKVIDFSWMDDGDPY